MKKYNAIVVFDNECLHVLMCLRSKEPYKNKLNFVGGKIENGENSLKAAYRELFEETGITRKVIELIHMMDFTYHITDCHVEIYVGKLNQTINLREEENPLVWVELSKDFSDLNSFAGEGDIPYIIQYLNLLDINNMLDKKQNTTKFNAD